MDIDERQRERAAAVEQREREDGIRRVLQQPAEPPRIRDGVRVCRACDQPIAPARLAAWPPAVRCVRCQTIHELKYPRGRR